MKKTLAFVVLSLCAWACAASEGDVDDDADRDDDVVDERRKVNAYGHCVSPPEGGGNKHCITFAEEKKK